MANDEYDCKTDNLKTEYEIYMSNNYDLHDLVYQISILLKQPDMEKALKQVIQDIDPTGLLDDAFQDMK